MAEFPLLPIPAPRLDERPRGGGGGGDDLRLPTVERQGHRIGPTFQRLRDAFAEERPAISLRNDPASIAPERAIVFEVAGSIGGFYAAVRQIGGLEYLGDEELDFEADDDFAVVDTRRGREGELRDDRTVGGRLYLAMPDTRALRELLRLWDLYQAGRRPERGFAPQSVPEAAYLARLGADRPDSGGDDRLLGGGAQTSRTGRYDPHRGRAVEFCEPAAAA
jgi:hypothetical protein